MKSISTLIALLQFANAQYDSSPIVPMSEYSKNYRTLNGWECFKANGKLCHDKDNRSMIKVTGSSNAGHGVCCKPDYNGEHCNSDADHKCSQPVSAEYTTEEFDDVLTYGMNYQMFAFLPKINPKTCGISNSDASDVEGSMRLEASTTKQTISLSGDKALAYRDGRPDVRKYDACYYEIGASADDSDFASEKDKKDLSIIINISKLKNLNAFVYGGKDRYSATDSINGNAGLITGTNYTVDYDEGMLLVVYPNKDVETDFEFEYYVAEYEKPMNIMVIAIALVVGLFLVCVIIACTMRKKANPQKIEIIDTETPGHKTLNMDEGSLELTVEEQPSKGRGDQTDGNENESKTELMKNRDEVVQVLDAHK